ncbi:GNAT family N-acetyltransferase [Micromonospora sp. WMMD882]|uniref:GNAT family N-acetyltransferase n=1 Tax=Micromonospora sp. WMMD882 TaxID=3015151 RepID=UPI00248C7E9D|nr:GNAT family N-acetyltransferase [Micromonospora sp. WMMD882]WBB82518.1 GNAT family N-acetyltransferase [Micromonospora sp. WMMD882]
MVREWDPRTAPSTEIASMLDTLNAVLAADLPDDPPWREVSLREYLSEVMPGERRISWVAQADPAADGTPGAILGHVQVLLLGDIGVLEVLVHPRARRTGLGRALVQVAARRTYQEGFRSLGVEVVGGTPAVGFYEALGFTRDYVEARSVLPLATVDWAALGAMATGLTGGYRVEFCPGGPPDALIESYARAKAEARDIEDGELRPSSYDPQRLRDSLDCLHRRGMKPYIVFAIHEGTGEVAGLTEVVVPAQHPTRADQYDTIVREAHRGYGIDRVIKARMLLELRAAEPELVEVQTWNAQANEAMLRVNAELGYRPDRQWCEYGADVAELVHRLDARGR